MVSEPSGSTWRQWFHIFALVSMGSEPYMRIFSGGLEAAVVSFALRCSEGLETNFLVGSIEFMILQKHLTLNVENIV